MNATSFTNGQPTWTARKPRQSTTARLSYSLLSRLLGRDPATHGQALQGELGVIVRHKGQEYAVDYNDIACAMNLHKEKHLSYLHKCKATFLFGTRPSKNSMRHYLPIRECTIRKGWE